MMNLTPIINAFIGVLVAFLLAYVIPWIKAKTTAKEREDLLVWVDIAVAAAQQLYYQQDGAKRLAYALDLLECKGFEIDDTVIDAVEAAVLKLHHSLKAGDSK